MKNGKLGIFINVSLQSHKHSQKAKHFSKQFSKKLLRKRYPGHSQIHLPPSWGDGGGFSDVYKSLADHAWVSGQSLAGKRIAVTNFLFFICITLEFRRWLRNQKMNSSWQESQYFTITLGSDLRGRFVHTADFFKHRCVVIHCHGCLGAKQFWGHCLGQQKQSVMIHQTDWVIRRKFSGLQKRHFCIICPILVTIFSSRFLKSVAKLHGEVCPS